jgi:hypothetical protein
MKEYPDFASLFEKRQDPVESLYVDSELSDVVKDRLVSVGYLTWMNHDIMNNLTAVLGNIDLFYINHKYYSEGTRIRLKNIYDIGSKIKKYLQSEGKKYNWKKSEDEPVNQVDLENALSAVSEWKNLDLFDVITDLKMMRNYLDNGSTPPEVLKVASSEASGDKSLISRINSSINTLENLEFLRDNVSVEDIPLTNYNKGLYMVDSNKIQELKDLIESGDFKRIKPKKVDTELVTWLTYDIDNQSSINISASPNAERLEVRVIKGNTMYLKPSSPGFSIETDDEGQNFKNFDGTVYMPYQTSAAFNFYATSPGTYMDIHTCALGEILLGKEGMVTLVKPKNQG